MNSCKSEDAAIRSAADRLNRVAASWAGARRGLEGHQRGLRRTRWQGPSFYRRQHHAQQLVADTTSLTSSGQPPFTMLIPTGPASTSTGPATPGPTRRILRPSRRAPAADRRLRQRHGATDAGSRSHTQGPGERHTPTPEVALSITAPPSSRWVIRQTLRPRCDERLAACQ